MAWISKKKLNKSIIELEKKISKLDPEKISEKIVKAINDLQEIPKGINSKLTQIVQEKTENLNDRLEKNETETKAQKEKLNNFHSRIKKDSQKIVNGIISMLEEVFGSILKEEPEKTISPDESETEETSDDKKTTAEEQVLTDDETNNAEPE